MAEAIAEISASYPMVVAADLEGEHDVITDCLAAFVGTMGIISNV